MTTSVDTGMKSSLDDHQFSTNDSTFLGKHSVSTSIKKSHIWILDTGASDHMIYDASLYASNIKPISINIQLPTGNFISASHMGNVKLNEHLTLHNVLYVPHFNFNLISVSSLALYENIFVHFTSNRAILQDHGPRTTDHLISKMIGYADIHNGLYHYNPDTSILPKQNHSYVVNSVSSDWANWAAHYLAQEKMDHMKIYKEVGQLPILVKRAFSADFFGISSFRNKFQAV
ncbi:unnamed protein product [Cuscuta epithymum]|uniref:Retrovirus-related Pol polyprotein from transposon TNT 1-94-like beta-barrel domain-containing protein n=1 Tax=Cuscuta epithymum TaxID=186058 RepID=A0AAV0GHU2_9ASTE|nr:unnamed protein product [Cuscuta epithymum]